MIDQNNWLDILGILRNEIVGDTTLFILIGALAVLYFCTLKRMPWQIHVVFLLLFLITLFKIFGVVIILVIVILLIGFLLYSAVKQILER